MITMELDGNEDCSNDLSVEQSLPSSEHMEDEVCGDQEIYPRIGEDYQVEIPDLLKKSDYLSDESLTYFENHHSEDDGVGSENSTNLKIERRSWSDVEKKRFVLGLYIFSRNFAQIKRFLESIKMVDILAYYYGSFYKSPEYCQWSDCRKIRKKGVVGEKIFSGSRQKEFISRISSSLPEEAKNEVLKVCTMFEEENITFEEFIFSMKKLVGIDVFVEAVGIGNGKQDLTTMALEPSRSNQTMPPIPTGKKCASLTYNEIVKYLTGNYRLSKARSSDLFWEAVWPRLLAKGWHSEEPKDQLYVVSGRKNGLVFIVPGIPEFSRRRLTNGSHYFDSVTDVLKKVASDPSLIVLENEDANENGTSKINQEDYGMKLKEEKAKRHCYLQPRASVCAAPTDTMKFTVVDTAVDDGKSYRVVEMSRLTFDFSYNKVDPIDVLEISDDNMSEEGSVVLSNREVLSERNNLEKNSAMLEPCPCPDSDRKRKEVDMGNIVPAVKKRKTLNACYQHAPDKPKPKNESFGLAVHHHDVAENSNPVSSHDELSLSSMDSQEGNQIQGSMNSQEGNQIQGSTDSQEGNQVQDSSVDLNLPADGETAFPETKFNGDHEENNKVSSFPEQQLNVNTQRRGTRNRPPTTRVLEAVAFGLLTVNTNTRRNGKTSKRKEKPSSRRPQRPRAETEMYPAHINPSAKESQNGASSDSNRSELREYQVLHEENEPGFSGP